jgi:pyridoxamine 5'-phosphate oxidase
LVLADNAFRINKNFDKLFNLPEPNNWQVMPMELKDVYEFANINPLCYLATVEGDQPRVRAFMLWYAGDKGFYFHTFAEKRVFQQLKVNPKMEVCFYATQNGAMMRAAGKAVVLDDLDLKKKLLEDLPYVKKMISGPEDPNLVVFRMQEGYASFWTIGENRIEYKSERIEF